MSDDDLELLMAEEYRLFPEYVHSNTEESRYPQRIERKRRAWVELYTKLGAVLTPAKRRELLLARAAEKKARKR